MKKETIEKIEDEITKKTTMPNDLKNNIRKEIFANIVLAIGIIVYFIFLMMGSIDSTKASRTIDFRIFSLVLLFTSICLFEVAYKKDRGRLAINGIEILIVSVVTLFLPYIVFELDSTHQKYYILSISLIAAYYIIKSIVINSRAKIKYERQESDIDEITKKEEKRVDYLDEEIEEKQENNGIENTNINYMEKQDKATKRSTKRVKKTIEKSSEEKNTKINEDKIENKPKKRGRPKKVVEELDSKENVKKETNKKTKTTTKQAKTEVGNNMEQKNEEKPKKRGRPRKVVESK